MTDTLRVPLIFAELSTLPGTVTHDWASQDTLLAVVVLLTGADVQQAEYTIVLAWPRQDKTACVRTTVSAP